MKRRLRQSLLLLVLALVLPGWLDAQEFRDTDLKAVFLLRFGSFMQWPEPVSGSAFVIGVLGDDPIAPSLEHAVRGEMVNGRPVEIVRFRDIRDVQTCAILYISRSRRENLPRILEQLRGRPILTVSDIEGFSEAGGMVALNSEDRRIRLRVNVGAARTAGIAISSKLLRVVEIVGEQPSNGA